MHFNMLKIMRKRRKLWSSQEIKELRQFIVQMKDKLASTAEKFPR
jgi:uncharacterized protein YdcH (DUF465 family)